MQSPSAFLWLWHRRWQNGAALLWNSRYCGAKTRHRNHGHDRRKSTCIAQGKLTVVFGGEEFDIVGLDDIRPQMEVILLIRHSNGSRREAPLPCRIDRRVEVDYSSRGGILCPMRCAP
jgi:hypothetical protein